MQNTNDKRKYGELTTEINKLVKGDTNNYLTEICEEIEQWIGGFIQEIRKTDEHI